MDTAKWAELERQAANVGLSATTLRLACEDSTAHLKGDDRQKAMLRHAEAVLMAWSTDATVDGTATLKRGRGDGRWR